MSERYNGWANYETWNANLWISNNEGDYNWATELAQEAWDNAEAGHAYESQTREQAAQYALRETLKDQIEEMPEELAKAIEGNMYGDLLNTALSSIDWYEIAGSWLEEVERDE